MATQYTSLLGLALPVQGELSGTWGDTVNNAITSLLDTAVAGTTTLSTDGDVTLSTTTGASNQARQAILLCSGARTALRTITAPAQSKIYTVINATTGGYSVKVVGAGPTTGVTIVAGESAVIAWNGSDFIKISNTGGSASFTNVTVSGTTTLSGLTASTALALNSSKEVVSVTNTGTGNNVLSASPTLTGTVAGASLQLSTLTSGRVTYAGASGLLQDSANLTFNGTDLTVSGAVNAGTINATTLDLTNLEVTNIKAKDGTAGMQIADSTGVVSFTANPVMSGGTANGVAYLNGSKVLTSGSALTFDGTGFKLTSDSAAGNGLIFSRNTNAGASAWSGYQIGNDGLANRGGILIASGAASASGFIGPNSTYFYNTNGLIAINAQSNNPILFGVNNTEQMRLTSTGLGIGTSSPVGKLDVSGTTYSRFLNTTAPTLDNDTHAGEALYLRSGGTAGSGNVQAVLAFGKADSSSQRSGAAIASIQTTADADQIGLGFYVSSGTASLQTMTQAAIITAAGNVGIGTSSPVAKLQVTSTTTAQGLFTGWSATGANTSSGAIRLGGNSSYQGKIDYAADGNTTFTYENTYASGVHNWKIAGSEQMRLTSTGLGIGTSSPRTKLDVTGNIYVASGNQIQITGSAGSTGLQLIGNDASESTIGTMSAQALVFRTNSTERARITSGGDLLVGTTSSATNASAGIKNITSTTSPSVAVVSTNSTSGGNSYFSGYSTDAGAYRFYVNNDGVIHATNTTISAISDIRFKENIRDLNVGLAEIMALKPRLYDWKEGKGADIKNARGFIAQEFEQVFPDLIDEWKDPAPEGEEPYKSVRQDLIPVLVKAIQEQQAIIDSLKARLDAANL